MLVTLLSVDVESKLQLAMVGVYSPKIQTCITLCCSKYLASTYQLFVVLRRYPLVLLRILLRTPDSTALWGSHYRICLLVLYEGLTMYNEAGPNHVGREHLYDIGDQP